MKITDLIKEVSIIHDGIETEETQIGNAVINTHGVKQAGEISITFTESKDGDVLKFLTQHDDGTPIIPTDGTSLMPYDFYFHIEVTHSSSDMYDKLIDSAVSLLFGGGDTKSLKGDFIIDGNITQNYVAGEPELQEIQATFKKLRSW
jgi:hypothetical protein